jgi:FecR protein
VGKVTRVFADSKIGCCEAAAVGMPVEMNDKISTGPEARLQITFNDGTVLTLGELAEVVVDRYVYNPSTSTGALALNSARGALRFVTGNIGHMSNKEVTVKTPQAALAVRGTDFWAGFVPHEGTYGVLLLEGKVDVSNSSGASTISDPNYGVDFVPCLKCDKGFVSPSEAYEWSEAKINEALSTTSFGVAAGPGAPAAAAAAAAAAIAAGQKSKPASP